MNISLHIQHSTLGDTTSTALDHNAYWAFTYNSKGELSSGKKKDASNNAFPGLNNEYTYDPIGNRSTPQKLDRWYR